MMDLGEIVSRDPARPSQEVWRGAPSPAEADLAVTAAREAFAAWSRLAPDARAEHLRAWASVVQRHAERIAQLICREMGKTLAEARQEAALLSDKVTVTLEERVRSRIAGYEVPGGPTRTNRCTWRPHGVMAVVGPFNFPAHLPNGHWVPALLAGNTVVFKPSERTPAVGALMGELMAEAGMPEGVFHVVQGRGDVAASLVAHPGIDGVLFTGSWPVGRRILEANLDRPGRMVALEMGGSNPAIVMDDADLRAAVIECVRCAFVTTGQRCTCTRRVIVHERVADQFIGALVEASRSITVGAGDADPAPFMGPLVSREAREAVLRFQADRAAAGARVLLEASAPAGEGWFLTPGVVQVDAFELASDREVFGPLLQVATCRDLDDAIVQANATEFGLAASVFTASPDAVDQAMHGLRAGCINVNCGTAGASGKLPFGGLGRSGNLRPAGAGMIDACAYPVASMIESGGEFPIPAGMRVPDRI
jgi:succinylglutamic semialdehyde dehydrogenase